MSVKGKSRARRSSKLKSQRQQYNDRRRSEFEKMLKPKTPERKLEPQ